MRKLAAVSGIGQVPDDVCLAGRGHCCCSTPELIIGIGSSLALGSDHLGLDNLAADLSKLA